MGNTKRRLDPNLVEIKELLKPPGRGRTLVAQLKRKMDMQELNALLGCVVEFSGAAYVIIGLEVNQASMGEENATIGMRVRRLEGNEEALGPTDNYPDGMMEPSDEGGLALGIAAVNGRVVLNFGTKVTWIGFGPEEAVRLGQLLIEKAKDAERQEYKPIATPSTHH